MNPFVHDQLVPNRTLGVAKMPQFSNHAPTWHTYKPDLDNIEKTLKDALSDIRVWGDDCQVCQVEKTKIYVTGMEAPVSDVTISLIP